MTDNQKQNARETEKVSKPAESGNLSSNSYEAEDIFEGAEPWEPIETKIVAGSFGAAIFFLIVFGYFINKLILH